MEADKPLMEQVNGNLVSGEHRVITEGDEICRHPVTSPLAKIQRDLSWCLQKLFPELNNMNCSIYTPVHGRNEHLPSPHEVGHT